MTRASALEAAARSSTDALAESSQPSADRRLSDSNAAWLGKVVDGRYKTVEVIGRGGTWVWRPLVDAK